MRTAAGVQDAHRVPGWGHREGREQWLTYRMRGKKAWENVSGWHGCICCDDQHFRPLGLNDMK